MNRQVNAIAGRLSLRPPQRSSLEILDRISEIIPQRKGGDPEAALATIQSEFPSLCFALATGVGKTRLMGAFISFSGAVREFTSWGQSGMLLPPWLKRA